MLKLVTSISADRSVSTPSVRLVHGMIPLVEERLADHDEAYISRDSAGEVTGLEPTKILTLHQPRQEREVGIVMVTRRGQYGMVPRKGGGWRGDASAWIVDLNAYTPRDIPVMDLESEAYCIDHDDAAISKNFLPTSKDWAKEPEAYRLVLALIHHVGFARVKVTPKIAAEILGKSRVTGWRALKALERLGFLVDGWVDYGYLLVSTDASWTDEKLEARTKERGVNRWSVFTREGWAVRNTAKNVQQMLPEWRKVKELNPRFEAHVGRDKIGQAIRYFHALFGEPGATGRPLDANDLMLLRHG